jgi:hypothetical protein
LYVAALFEGTVYKIIFPFVQGIEEASKLSFGLSPNPVKNNLSIQLPGHALVRMRVYNTMGVLVKGVQMSQQNDRLSMDISSLPTGIFYVSIVQDGKRRVQKFLKI